MTHSLFNLQELLKEIIKIFEHHAVSKKIDLQFIAVNHDQFVKCRRATDPLKETDLAKYMPTHIYGDSVRLQQVLINLLRNALKFTLYGTIRVITAYDWAQ